MASRLKDFVTVRVPQPPPSKGAQDQWQRDVSDALNEFPNFSVFSFSNPNSNVTAQAPALGFNIASNVSGLWFKQVGSNNTGWVALA